MINYFYNLQFIINYVSSYYFISSHFLTMKQEMVFFYDNPLVDR
jgi:hypothetical protein